jgi:glycerol-3-phosphate dehydrogenase
VPLPGAAAADFNTFSKEFKESSGLSEGTTDRLLRIYGTRSSVVLETIKENSSLAEVFDTETGAISAEVVCAFKNEKAQTLSDALFRRTMVGLNSACGLNAIEPAVSIVQKHLGWSGDRVAQEISAYRNYIERFKLE